MISPRSLPGAIFVSSDSGAVSRIGLRRSNVGTAFSRLIEASLSALERGDERPERAVEGDEGAGRERRRARRPTDVWM